MENSRFVFSVGVGLILLLAGAGVATKASIGIALMLLGISLVVLAVITRKMQADMQMALLPIAVLATNNHTGYQRLKRRS
ncbi:MAG: putative membrane protein (Fun14 family) [Oceanicoccus sp.]|jgi:uncharacterized membrane protein (Fun14 family)